MELVFAKCPTLEKQVYFKVTSCNMYMGTFYRVLFKSLLTVQIKQANVFLSVQGKVHERAQADSSDA